MPRHLNSLGTAADIFVQAQFPLHSGRILGLPGRILVSVMGLVAAAVSVTGVVIWWRKRAARVRRRAHGSPSGRSRRCRRNSALFAVARPRPAIAA